MKCGIIEDIESQLYLYIHIKIYFGLQFTFLCGAVRIKPRFWLDNGNCGKTLHGSTDLTVYEAALKKP